MLRSKGRPWGESTLIPRPPRCNPHQWARSTVLHCLVQRSPAGRVLVASSWPIETVGPSCGRGHRKSALIGHLSKDGRRPSTPHPFEMDR